MQRPHIARSTIIYGLICAGMMTGTGPAFAASQDTNKTGMDKPSPGQPSSGKMEGASRKAKELSQQAEQFNENRGSLDEQGATGTGTDNATADADRQPAGEVDGASAEAQKLSEEIEQYNENAGSLDESGASETGPDSGAAERGQQSAGEMDGASSEAQELSEEIEQYNENAGSLDEPSATETGPEDNRAAD